MHEYTVIGHPREKIVFGLAIASIAAAPPVSGYLVNLASNWIGIVVALSISASTMFGVLFFIFNKWLWRFPGFAAFFSFPNISGEWNCTGKSLNQDGSPKYDWSGTVRIEQSWDKILISLVTSNSSSTSMSILGGMKHYPGLGYKVSYGYENTPNVDQKELRRHSGFCEITFIENVESANGYYFTGPEKMNYGTMALKRKVP